MGLNCGCPIGEALPKLQVNECKESLGQIQKVLIQRIYKSDGVKNSLAISTVLSKKTGITPLLAAEDGTKLIVSPYIQNPTTTPGEARTFGGGNQTLGGIEIVIGREPTTFEGVIYQESQVDTIRILKQYSCENIGVYLIDENGNIAGIDPDGMGSGSDIYPIPIGKFFVGDKNLGGFEEPDSNTISWSFFPNWSDTLVIIKHEQLDYNPLTDLVNA